VSITDQLVQQGHEVMTAEHTVPWVNASGVETYEVQPFVNKVAREISSWIDKSRNMGRGPSLFNRAAYVSPDNPYAQMGTARSALENDDIVGGVCDVTEGFIFQGLKWESEDALAADVFNQIAQDLDLDELARQWHREDFTYSQSILGVWWGTKTYTPKAKTDGGKKSKKKISVQCPVAWTFLDPTKVVPLKPGPFGEDRLAWNATKAEFAAASAGVNGAYMDPLLREFTVGIINLQDRAEIDLVTSWGMDPRRLLLLNPSRVFRMSRTKMTYDRFPVVRLKSVFPLLDLKQQLIEADRVSLVGAANFILLVRQGTKEEPATQEEVDNLKENFKVVAKLPVVVGDHRLSIDIITPAQEHVLQSEKYDLIDRRIMQRAMGALAMGSSGQRNESTVTIARGIARLLENRRHMFKRRLEKEFARRIMDHPDNEGLFDHEPNLVFTPKNVQLDDDAEVARSILALRTSNEISRESTLEHFGFDQATEALRREFEEDNYDDIFKTQVPFSAGQPGAPAAPEDPNNPDEPAQVSGARGGRPPGGGSSPQSPQGQSGGRNARGQKSTSK
jgi:hypothetical protein